MTVRLLLVLPVLAAGGCTRDAGVYPSLAPRAVEEAGFAEPPAPPPAVARPDPALDARIAAARTRLAEIGQGFDRAADAAGRAARLRGARTVGSEAWLGAQSQLAELDDWRAQATALASDLDALAVERAARLDPVYPALAALTDAAKAEATRQTAAIDRLQALTPAA